MSSLTKKFAGRFEKYFLRNNPKRDFLLNFWFFVLFCQTKVKSRLLKASPSCFSSTKTASSFLSLFPGSWAKWVKWCDLFVFGIFFPRFSNLPYWGVYYAVKIFWQSITLVAHEYALSTFKFIWKKFRQKCVFDPTNENN